MMHSASTQQQQQLQLQQQHQQQQNHHPQLSQQNVNPNNQSVNYSVPKKPQFYPVIQNNSTTTYISSGQHQNKDKMITQSQLQLQHQMVQYSQKLAQTQGNSVGKPSTQSKTAKYKMLPPQHNQGALPIPQVQSQNVSSHHYQFQTPTHSQQQQAQLQLNAQVFQQQQMLAAAQARKKKKAPKKFKLIVKILEAELFVSKTKFFQMNVHVKLKMKDKELKTNSQNGMKPKFNETFVFEDVERKSKIEFSVYHKSMFSSEEMIGNAIFIFQELYPYNLKQFITLCDNGVTVGGLRVNLNVVQSNAAGQSGVSDSMGVGGEEPKDSQQQEENEDENEDVDVDEAMLNSIDYRDHEISRQIVSNQNLRNPNSRQQLMMQQQQVKPDYKGLQTQQQVQSSSVYLATQINQARQSVTENSIIHHYSNTNSSQEQDDDGNGTNGLESRDEEEAVVGVAQDSVKHQGKHRHRHRHHHHHHHKHGGCRGGTRDSRNKYRSKNRIEQQIFTEEEQVAPQQLFQGVKGQGGGGLSGGHHSNSSNNLLMPPKYHQQQLIQQQQHTNSQFLYLEDLSANMGYAQQHLHKSQNNKSQKRTKMQMLQQQMMQIPPGQQQQMIQVDPFLEDLSGNEQLQQQLHQQQQQQEMIGESEDEMNYGHYLNQRAGGVLSGAPAGGASNFGGTMINTGSNGQNQITSSHSQQLLSAMNKHQTGFDSGGGTSGSGGGQQLYGISGGFNLGPGSNGSQFPLGGVIGVGGPSYFEEQNSIESLNDGLMEPQSISGHQQILMNPNIGSGGVPMLPPQYDISEFQDLEQLKLDLKEENDRQANQDMRLKTISEKYIQKLHKEKLEMRKQKEQLKNEKDKLSSQKEELEYQRQQMERAYVALKQDKVRFTQSTMLLEELNKQFTECVKRGKLLQTNSNGEKTEEFINLMKGIHYMLQQLIQMQHQMLQHQQQRSQSRMMGGSGQAEESKQNTILGHLQQESTSSCATNSTGNYNFLLQGAALFHQHPKLLSNQSPIHSKGTSGAGPAMIPFHIKNSKGMLGQIQQQNSNNQSRLGVNGLPDQVSPPKVITDIINTEEDEIIDGLADQDLRLSPQAITEIAELDAYDLNAQKRQLNIASGPSSNGGGIKSGTNRGHQANFLNEGELSTIIERELTSQRRSSNGGLGPNTTIDGRQNALSIAPIPINSLGTQFQPQASAFQMLPGDQLKTGMGTPYDDQQDTDPNMFVTNQSRQKPAGQKATTKGTKGGQDPHQQQQQQEQSENTTSDKKFFEEEKKAYEERKQELEGLYQQVYKELENIQKIKQGMLSQFDIEQLMKGQQKQQQETVQKETPDQFIQSQAQNLKTQVEAQSVEEEKRGTLEADDVVHITASDIKSMKSLPQSLKQHQNAYGEAPKATQRQPSQQEDSMDFVPDPDFLLKINMNMRANDRFFDAAGKLVQPSNNQPQTIYGNSEYNEEEIVHGGGQQEEEYEEDYIYQWGEGTEGQAHNIEQVNMLDMPNPAGDRIFLSDPADTVESVHNRSTQGQGEGKRVYIQDDFEDIDIHVEGGRSLLQEEDGSGTGVYDEFGNQLRPDEHEEEEEKYGTIQRASKYYKAPKDGKESHTEGIDYNEEQDFCDSEGKYAPEEIDPIKLLIKSKKERLSDEEIQILIDANYLFEENGKDQNMLIEGKLFDERKKAVYGIMRSKIHF